MTLTPTRLWPDSATIIDRSRSVFFARWEELLRLRRFVTKASNADDIYELRVALRRFRAALDLLCPFVPKGPKGGKEPKTELRKNVRTFKRILGGLRTIDKAQRFFQSRITTDSFANTNLLHALSELRNKELKRTGKALRAFDHHHLDRIVRELVGGINVVTITEKNSISLLSYFSEVSIRQYMPIHQLQLGATAPGQRVLRHALHNAIKKWGYFFEIISQTLDRDYKQTLDLIKEYQGLLGRMNDIAVLEVLISHLKLPPDERKRAEDALRAEDTLLLNEFSELIEQKPLTYTFLI